VRRFRQGELVGEVKDLIDVNHQLSFISNSYSFSSRMFLISSNLFRKLMLRINHFRLILTKLKLSSYLNI